MTSLVCFLAAEFVSGSVSNMVNPCSLASSNHVAISGTWLR